MSFSTKKHKRSLTSVTPDITFLRKQIKVIDNFVDNGEERLKEGRRLAMLEAGSLLKKHLVDSKTKIENVDYKDLKIAYVESGEEVSVSLVFEETTVEVSSNYKSENAVYYVRAREGAPKWVSLLVQNNPYVLDLLPIRPRQDTAVLIKRNVSSSEKNRVRQGNLTSLEKLKFDLKKEGVKINKDKKVKVLFDVGFSVLRAEFGYGEKQQSHWRPAIRELFKEMKQLGEKVSKYILNGNENIFEIDQESVYRLSSIDTNESFESAIGTAVGLKK